MVVTESEMIAQIEVDSSAMPSSDHHQKTHVNAEPEPENNNNNGEHHRNSSCVFPNLGRQSSIYSLTLEEFQHTLCESGKNFGSMNMDEFLNSIWTAEENQAHQSHEAQAQAQAQHHHDQRNLLPSVNAAASSTSRGAIAKQPSLPRQGSLSLPAPLCSKTVDEVWSEIQNQNQSQSQHNQNQNQVGDDSGSGSAQRQPTFGELTLEDFLIKAGVVREQCGPTPVAVAVPGQHHSQYGFSSPHTQMGSSFVARPMMPTYQGMAVSPTGNRKRNNGYPNPTVAPSVACYGARVNNGGPTSGGFGAGLSPISLVSPDRLCGPGQVDYPGGQYGLELAVLRGRKRIIDGPVEKVVERRQRRMIKNRESAARSRARKQAYTVELEAELNQLREDNAQLKQALTEIERQRKQQYVEEQKMVSLSRAQRAQEKLKTMRRSCSCNL